MQSKSDLKVAAVDADSFAAAPEEVRGVLAEVDAHLQAGRPDRALHTLSRAKVKSPWLANAAAVCHLRLGRPEQALDKLRPFVLHSVGSTLKEDAPAVFKINYAVTLLATDDFQRFLTVWPWIRTDPHPTVRRIRDALERGKRNLSAWQRITWRLGLSMGYPVTLDFPLGDLA